MLKLFPHKRYTLLTRNTPYYLSMLLPAAVLLLLFNYLPMSGIIIAFQRFVPAKGLFSPNQKWVGLQQFKMAFSDPYFSQAIRNTLFLAITKIVLTTIVSIAAAIAINELRSTALRRSIQTVFYLPHFISWVILSTVLRNMLTQEGIINTLIAKLGGHSVGFMTDNSVFPWVLILTDVWKEFGFGSIIYLAAITQIDPSLYEAAIVDGAKKRQQIFYITLPGMMYIIILIALLSIGGIFNANFDQVFNMYSPNVFKSGDVLDTLIYRKGIVSANYSLATAIGLFKSVITCFLISVSYYLAYRYADYRVF